jgi:hypothetical protein
MGCLAIVVAAAALTNSLIDGPAEFISNALATSTTHGELFCP